MGPSRLPEARDAHKETARGIGDYRRRGARISPVYRLAATRAAATKTNSCQLPLSTAMAAAMAMEPPRWREFSLSRLERGMVSPGGNVSGVKESASPGRTGGTVRAA